MSFEALDGTKLLILMIAGAAFAAAGLFLLMKRRPIGAAKIELFGLKFESSSAGLLVFFIGAAFMAIPLFAPERMDSSNQNTNVPAVNGVVNSLPAIVDPQSAEAQVVEMEPNGGIGQASILQPGQTLSGNVREEDSDWIKILLPDGADPEVTIRVRKISNGTLWASFHDASEVWLGSSPVNSGAVNKTIDTADAGVAYVRLSSGGGNRIKYEVLTVP